eukprot:TRINITY_DN1578_c0_g1_i1.p1 TRINITY_DN1578_c0_g1~~TRINITY_DN1578_c0_g1_i1.p1  ORF type:complete len:123 (-),score=15.12 TRINITY_DN1578_c0_g1_i1:470-838(-)
MATNTLLVISLLTFILSSQAMLFGSDLGNTTCMNGTRTVMCNNTAQRNYNPGTCCEVSDAYICCEDVPGIIGIIVGAIVAFCVVCIFLPLLIIVCCCCCFMGSICGRSGLRHKTVYSGYQRV